MNLPDRHRHKDWRSLQPFGRGMRPFASLCLLLFATAAAHAVTPEQHYLDLRDRYIAKFSQAKESEETSRQHDAALNELTGVLRGLVGPVTIKGLPAEGK